MSSDILTILQSQAHTFSKGQRLIAKYITESYDKAAFMTASKLGKKVGVSESTVVRFAVELGYDGYPSMQKAIQEMVLHRLTSVQRIEVANARMEGQDVISSVLRSVSGRNSPRPSRPSWTRTGSTSWVSAPPRPWPSFWAIT